MDLFFHYNILAIEVLFGLVLLGVIFLTIRSFLRPESSSAEVNLGGLEEGLKKMMENYAGERAGQSSEGMGGGDAIMDEMATQIERLKIQLMQKTEEVEQLKAGGAVAGAAPADSGSERVVESVQTATTAPSAAAPSPSTSSSGTVTALEEKVKDLEARLSEYSIIEDDIADLSFYKEETVRLQAEVDKLKEKVAEYEAGGPPPRFMAPPPPAEVAAPSPKSAPVPPVVSLETAPPSSNSESTAAAPSPMSSESAPLSAGAAPPTTPADNAGSSIDDDIMAEFERAVAEQKASAAATPQKIVKKLPPEAAVTAAPETPPAAPSTETTEVIAKTETPSPSSGSIAGAPSPESEAAPSPDSSVSLVAEEGINLDKMMNEVSALPEESTDSIANALEQELDTDKLLQEATGMDKEEESTPKDVIDEDTINALNGALKKKGA